MARNNRRRPRTSLPGDYQAPRHSVTNKRTDAEAKQVDEEKKAKKPTAPIRPVYDEPERDLTEEILIYVSPRRPVEDEDGNPVYETRTRTKSRTVKFTDDEGNEQEREESYQESYEAQVIQEEISFYCRELNGYDLDRLFGLLGLSDDDGIDATLMTEIAEMALGEEGLAEARREPQKRYMAVLERATDVLMGTVNDPVGKDSADSDAA